MNKSFRILLLRHGNTFEQNEIPYQIGCQTDLPLTEKGLSQAQQFTHFLQDLSTSPYAIYCGSLQRQIQTASVLHRHFPEAKLNTHQSALNEIDYGQWEGLTQEAIQAKWPQEYLDWSEQGMWPQSVFHSHKQFHLDALQKWLSNINETAPNNALIVAISSGGIITLLLNLMPQLWDSLVSNRKMKDYKVGTGHYCDVVFDNFIPTIQSWNSRP